MSHQQAGAKYQVVAFMFAGRQRATAISDELKRTGKYQASHVVAYQVVEVDDEGRAHFPEVGRRVQDVALGVLAGSVLGLLGGPEGLLVWAVLGALVGSQLDRFRSRPIPTKDLQRLAAQMRPDSSAILTLVNNKQGVPLVDALAGYGAQVVKLTVDDQIAGEIDQALAGPSQEDHEL
jgi:uncharacterized membrane protein